MSESKSIAIIPSSFVEVQSMAEALSKSTLLPDALKGKTADLVFSILAGQELGLSPLASIRGVHIIQGKPVLSADTMVGLVLASGKCEYFTCVEESDTKVVYEAKRVGALQPQRGTFSMDDAKRAALEKRDNWRSYPRAMMKARAKAALARDLFPDVLAGVHTEDEMQPSGPRLEYRQPVAVNDVIDAEIVNETSESEPPELAAIDAAQTVDQLKSMSPALTKLTGPLRAKARDRYGARLAALKAQEEQPAVEATA